MNKIFLFVLLFIFSSCNSQEKLVEQHELGTKVTKIASSWIIFQDEAGNHWFGGNDKGVYVDNGREIILYTTKDGLCSNGVVGIQEDDKGNIYFDTQEGICRFDGKEFKTLEIIDSSDDLSNWKLEPGDLWFRKGWDSSGPYRFDGEHLYALQFPKNTEERAFRSVFPKTSYNPYSVYSIFKDSKGHMWFGTSNLGIYRFDGETISWMYEDELTNIPGGGAFGIRSIVEDKEGYFWICNSQQKFEMKQESIAKEPVNLIAYEKLPGISYNDGESKPDFPYFMSAVVDNEGALWMLTYELGMYRYDGEKMEHFPIRENGEQIKLFSIYKDNDGVLWLGTHDAGVYRYNGAEFEKYKK